MFKLLGVGALILLMLIPLLMIEGVLNDRLVRRNEAVADITASWRKEQNIIGPVLCVPYLHHGKVVRSVTLPDGRVEFVNRRWREYTGLDLGQPSPTRAGCLRRFEGRPRRADPYGRPGGQPALAAARDCMSGAKP